MKQTSNSIFTRALAVILCLVMLAGTLTSCFQGTDINNGDGTTADGNTDNSGTPINPGTGSDTGNNEKDPSEDTPSQDDPSQDDPFQDKPNNEIFSASTEIGKDALIYGSLANNVTIGASNGVSAVLPADVKIADGTSSLALSVKLAETSADLPLNEGDVATSLDVHIDGIDDNNTVPMIVNLGSVFSAGIAKTGLKFYHIEDGVPKLMTRVNSEKDFAIHNQYTYHALTGEVSIYVASFSVFTAVETTADEWDGTSDTTWYNENDTEFTLTTAEQLSGFRALVDGGNTFKGKTVKLGADINLEQYKVDENGNYLLDEENNKIRVSFDPIGFGYWNESKVDAEGNDTNTVFMGTFDGAGHTIYNLYQNGWDLGYSYSTAGGGLFASIKDATIKNLAVSGANIVMECIDMGTVVGYAQGTCHFENIIVTNSKLANYQRYTGGVVGEVSYGPYGTDTSKGYSHTFKNVTVDSSVTISSLWGDFDNACGGVIGGKWGDATVKMENVTVACEIDAFSDVTAAYQWYAYRRCGMLVGHTEQNSPKKATNAAADFLTCENVKVYYGDWVNYTYYQFANQDSATGQRYPWVRAEAGEHNAAFSNPRYGVPTYAGEKVSEMNAETLNAKKTGFANITFDQLYGGGQGVYGCNEHDGVTVTNKLNKTVYIHNNAGWTNLKLDYWFANGDDTWTTIVDSIDISKMLLENNVYKIEVPIYAEGFKITADGENVKEFDVSDVANNGFYLLEGKHEHDFSNNNTCICGCKKVIVNIAEYATANGWSSGQKYTSITMNGDISVTTIDFGNNGRYYSSGNNWRIYQSDNGTFTITSISGNILSVKITYESENTGVLTFNGKNVTSETEVSVDTTSATFGMGNTGLAANGQARITDIEVIYSTVLACAHKYTTTETKTPTCTQAGYTATRCADCGKVMAMVDGDPAIGHSYNSEVTKEATCTEAGVKTFTCETCQTGYTQNISAKGHSYNSEVTKEATCTNDGVKTYTCATCSDSYTETIAATGHSYTGGTCTTCGEAEPAEPETPAKSGWVKTDLADIEKTDIVVIVWTTSNGTSYAMSNDKGTSAAPTAVVVKVDDNTLTGDIVDTIKWNIISNDDGTLTIYPNGTTSTWLYCTSTNNGVRVGTNANKVFTIDATSGYLKHTATSRYLGVYTTTPDVRCYTNTTGNTANQTIAFYKLTEGTTGSEPTCEHTNTTTTTTATCTAAGVTTVTCDGCNKEISKEETVALGHTTDNGTCERCGEEIGGTTETVEATLSFTNVDNRTSKTTTQQIWSQNGITLTNNKASSTSDVADYSNPARFYANSEIVVKATGEITKIEFDCNSSSYATALNNSIGTVSDVIVTVSDDKVTVEFSNAVDSFTIAKLTAQIRMDSITVTYTK